MPDTSCVMRYTEVLALTGLSLAILEILVLVVVVAVYRHSGKTDKEE